MSRKWADLLEAAILGRLVTSLIDDGYRLELSDQDGGGLFCYAAPDAGELVAPHGYWVRLQPGNGTDFIVDWSPGGKSKTAAAFQLTIQPALDLAEQYRD